MTMTRGLATLGWSDFFAAQMSAWPSGVPARVAAEHRGAFDVWADGASGRAQLAGRLRRGDQDETALPGVGDWVVLSEAPGADRIAIIEHVLQRRSLFTRGAAGREARAQVIAANIDRVFAVCGLDHDFNPRRIERYVARIAASGAEAEVVLNKADVCDDVSAREAEVMRSCPGVPIYSVSALLGQGIDALRASIGAGMTVALVGSSGAGKSTLVNALIGRAEMLTGEVRAHDSHGRHTTTHRQLVLLPSGGILVDTPGMRELQLVDEDGLDAVFGDVTTLAAQCRYRDCTHHSEPGCAVIHAVDEGTLDPERLDHYRKLQREAAAYELRHNERQRRATERQGGRLSDEAAKARRFKEGK